MVTKKSQQEAGSDPQLLSRVIKEALKSGKYTVGTKEVIAAMKSSKLVIATSSLRGGSSGDGLMREAKKSNVPVVHIDKSSSQLGKMVGRPFRVSAIAIRSIAEGDFRQLVGSPSTPVKPSEE